MSDTREARQFDNVVAPIAGQVTALAVTTTAANIDLATCGDLTSNSQNGVAVGCVEKPVAIQADGGTVYVIFGANAEAVATTNAPLPTAVGVNVTQGCVAIPSGFTMRVRPVAATRFMSYVTASGTATVRIWQSGSR